MDNQLIETGPLAQAANPLLRHPTSTDQNLDLVNQTEKHIGQILQVNFILQHAMEFWDFAIAVVSHHVPQNPDTIGCCGLFLLVLVLSFCTAAYLAPIYMKDRHEREVLTMKDSHEREVLTMKDSHEREVLTMKDSHELKVLTMKDSHELKVLDRKNGHEVTMFDRQSDRESANKVHERMMALINGTH